MRENLTCIRKHISKQEQVLKTTKTPFSARKYSLSQENRSYSETMFLNQDKDKILQELSLS